MPPLPLALDIEADIVVPIAEALRLPVVLLVLAALLAVIVEVGAFATEVARRRRRDFGALERATGRAVADLARDDPAGAARGLRAVAWSRGMGDAAEQVVLQVGEPGAEDRAAKVLADFDFRSLRRLERTRLLVRFGPALGLMGTLIPLSPALAGLARGDLAQLSADLRLAFGITVLGVLVGAVAFAVSLVRDRLYGQDLSDLEYVATAVLAGDAGSRRASIAADAPTRGAPRTDGGAGASVGAPVEPPTAVAGADGPPRPTPPSVLHQAGRGPARAERG